jgi:Fic family protein
MNNFANILKTSRKSLKLNLAEVSSALGIDKAIVSKLENGQRVANRKQVIAFIHYYKLDEKDVMSAWLSDKILYALKDEDFSLDALKVAEDTVKYNSKNKVSIIDKSIQDLIDEIDALKLKWDICRPIDGIALEKMHEYYSVKYTYDSNRIEGNTLTMQETFLVVKEGLTISGKTMTEHLEAVNHFEAIDFIVDLVKEDEFLTERVLKQIHYLILKSIDKANAGVYRKLPVFISGSSHIPPQPYLVAKQMEEVFEFYESNKNKVHPVILAADMHEKIVTVHPFIDGNGRTSRLIMNLVLLINGFPIAIIKSDNDSRQAYYDSLESVRVKNSPNDFYKLVLDAAIESIKIHISVVEPPAQLPD